MEQNNVKKITYIDIQVRARVANPVGNPFIVCGNKDYAVRFDFDEDWAGYGEKTARFVFNGKFIDVPFTGNECPVPMLSKTSLVKVGAYVDGLSTTSPAVVRCVRSVLCGNESEAGTGSVVDLPLTVTENCVIETPKNMRYNPITVDVQVDDQPLTLTENGTTEAPDGVRYTPITVDIPKPTLNAPKIEFNANGGYMYILDGANGNFSEGYQLYLNGEENVILTSTNIKMQDYGITETDEIGIVAVGNLFNNSPMATARWSDLELGTIGLEYSGNTWAADKPAYYPADADVIYVASIVNGVTITKVAQSAFFNDTVRRTVYLPNSITNVDYNFMYRSSNKTIVFGSGISYIESNFLAQPPMHTSIVIDLRKALQIPTLAKAITLINNVNYKIVVRDDMYDDIIVATNWSATPNIFVKASIYEAQQGGTV